MANLPSIVFGLVALGPAMLALLLPDTSQSALPDDVMDAENLDKAPEDEQTHDEVPRLSVTVTGEKQTHEEQFLQGRHNGLKNKKDNKEEDTLNEVWEHQKLIG